jgi:hypothetical protein
MSHPGERCHASAENFKKVRVDRVKMSDQRNLELDLGRHQTSSCLDLLPYQLVNNETSYWTDYFQRHKKVKLWGGSVSAIRGWMEKKEQGVTTTVR